MTASRGKCGPVCMNLTWRRVLRRAAPFQPGDVYLDVGAHVGFHAVFAAHRVGPEGYVFAFEADPRIYNRLTRNLSQFRWAQAVNAAVWDRTGSLAFERSFNKQESGWGIVRRRSRLGFRRACGSSGRGSR